MPDTSPSEFSVGRRYREPSRRVGALSIVSLVVAIGALVLAGWTLYRLEYAEASYSDAQRVQAKANICKAMDLVRKGVSLNTNLRPAGGPEDVTGAQAMAANARVALYDGGQYLLAKLDPATPTDLADEVRKFANNLMDIGAAATAGSLNSDPDQAARLRDADATNDTIAELCK
jgi:hypothetical protein